MKQLDIARIQEKLDDAWLNLPDIYYEQNHYNPFEEIAQGEVRLKEGDLKNGKSKCNRNKSKRGIRK